jgi:hypothetical protein
MMARVRSVAARNRREWSDYYRAALTGMLSAQIKQPNQQLVARWCAEMADTALHEAHHRHPIKLFRPRRRTRKGEEQAP